MMLLIPKIASFISDLNFRINKKKIESKKIELSSGFTVTYHAGAMHTRANSIYSVRAAVEDNADIVELDVTFRQDGTPVIIHSSNPTEKQGELLGKALGIVAGHPSCRINLDLKSLVNLGEVDRLVKDYGLFDRVFYTGVFEDWVETVKNNSEIPYYLNHKITEEEASDAALAQNVADKAKSLGVIGINSHFENASTLFTEVMHKNGLLVSLWTVNEISDMPSVLCACPDNITTKNPHLLVNVIDYMKKTV